MLTQAEPLGLTGEGSPRESEGSTRLVNRDYMNKGQTYPRMVNKVNDYRWLLSTIFVHDGRWWSFFPLMKWLPQPGRIGETSLVDALRWGIDVDALQRGELWQCLGVSFSPWWWAVFCDCEKGCDEWVLLHLKGGPGQLFKVKVLEPGSLPNLRWVISFIDVDFFLYSIDDRCQTTTTMCWKVLGMHWLLACQPGTCGGWWDPLLWHINIDTTFFGDGGSHCCNTRGGLWSSDQQRYHQALRYQGIGTGGHGECRLSQE